MTCFYDRLEQRIAKCGNPVCMGMDPVLKLIPLEGNWDGAVEDEYFDDESPRYLAIEVNE